MIYEKLLEIYIYLLHKNMPPHIDINEIKGFVVTIHKSGIIVAIHMLRDTPGGGIVSWHMKYYLKCIFIRFVQIYMEMWIIIFLKMRI